jgi:hypothetical protein
MNMIFRMLHASIRSFFCDHVVAEGTATGCVSARGIGVVKPDKSK